MHHVFTFFSEVLEQIMIRCLAFEINTDASTIGDVFDYVMGKN